jgi:putative transposase
MLTDQELEEYCASLKLLPHGISFVKDIRKNPPARNAKGGRENVSGFYPSPRMKCTIQFESRTGEKSYIYLLEHDRNVLEFWDQPEPGIRLSYERDGRKTTQPHIPDFFVLERNGCGWVECKPRKDLIERSGVSNRFVEVNGVWRCPPGEAVAADYGFFYRVICENDINQILVANFEYLDDYYRTEHAVSDRTRKAVKQLVASRPGVTLKELRVACPEAGANEINAMLMAEEVYADLALFSITEKPEKVRIFRDFSLATALQFVDQQDCSAVRCPIPQLYEGAKVKLGTRELEVTLIGNGIVLMTGDGDIKMQEQTVHELLSKGEMTVLSAPVQDLKVEATAFLNLRPPSAIEEGWVKLQEYNDPEQFAKLSERTRERRRWCFRQAAAEYGPDFGWFGFIPRRDLSGRKPMLLPSAVTGVLETAFKSIWEKAQAVDFPVFWREVKLQAGKLGIGSQMVCRKLVKKWVVQRSDDETMKTREGTTRAASKAPPKPIIDDTTPHGRWPWDRVYIDHTKVDLQLLLGEQPPALSSVIKTLRPWLSVMLDGYSRCVLAFVLDFNAPSNRACMHLTRECVRKHKRLPKTLVLDNGKEFKSTYFRQLMANCKITADYRPPRRPRFGAQIERWFETANTRLFHQLIGNTKIMKNARQLTSAVDPTKLAVWTLEMLQEALLEFCYEVYNDIEHSSLGCSPNQKYAAGIKEHGLRETRSFPYTEDFVRWTLPSTPKGTVRIGEKGVSVLNILYWDDAMRRHIGEDVPMRYDPCDISKVYVYIDDHWVWAKSGIHQVIAGMSEKQREIASKALRLEQKQKGEKQDASDRKLGEFMQKWEGKQAIAHQKKLDLAYNQAKLLTEGQTEPGDKTQGQSEAPEGKAPASVVKEKLPPRKKLAVRTPNQKAA